jgi:hypothetical protein
MPATLPRRRSTLRGVATKPRKPADAIDNPIERLELLAGDDDAIAAYLDDLAVRGAREREMLTELARTRALADPGGFAPAHHRAVAALESLGRHGYHGSQSAGGLGPLKVPVRFLVQLVARFVVVSYLRQVSIDLRNLYWLREMEAEDGSAEMKLLRAARIDAEALIVVFTRRQLGLPSFVVGGALVSILATAGRAAGGFAFATWWAASITTVVGVLVGPGGSWVILRGAAMASRRIRVSTRAPLGAVWAAIGNCGRPPRDQSRAFALIGITLTVGAWLILPAVVAIVFAF